MSPVAKGIASSVIVISLFIVGFIVGLRSCLSKYDERSAIPPILYFKSDTGTILFSLVKYEKVGSYSRSRGLTHKTVSNHYFVQSNNAFTGEKIRSREIASNIKNFPETVLGAEGHHAWIFINELMAFDAFNLETVADVKMIEAKNPSLKGMMPRESQYYQFDNIAKGIIFKSNDGAQWIIHSNSLIANPYVQPKSAENETLAQRTGKQWQQRLKELQKPGLDFNQIKVNQDTFNQQWLGIYSEQEIEALDRRFLSTPYSGLDARRQIYTASYRVISSNRLEIDSPKLQVSNAGSYFLNAGFLVDQQTGKAIQLEDSANYLLISKSAIGMEGSVIVSRISKDGKILWQLNSGEKKWLDYKFKGNRLFIFANDNMEVDSNDCTVLLIVDGRTGEVNKYDYFKDAIRK